MISSHISNWPIFLTKFPNMSFFLIALCSTFIVTSLIYVYINVYISFIYVSWQRDRSVTFLLRAPPTSLSLMSLPLCEALLSLTNSQSQFIDLEGIAWWASHNICKWLAQGHCQFKIIRRNEDWTRRGVSRRPIWHTRSIAIWPHNIAIQSGYKYRQWQICSSNIF